MGYITTTDVQTGQVISAATENNNLAAIKTVVNGNIDDANIAANAGIQLSKLGSGAFSSWSPTLSASGGGAALGDGAMAGWYQQVGKTVVCNLLFTIGAATSLGAGFLMFTPPVAGNATRNYFGGALLIDAPSSFYAAMSRYDQASGKIVLHTLGQPGDLVGYPTPFAFGAGDQIMFSLTYEAA